MALVSIIFLESVEDVIPRLISLGCSPASGSLKQKKYKIFLYSAVPVFRTISLRCSQDRAIQIADLPETFHNFQVPKRILRSIDGIRASKCNKSFDPCIKIYCNLIMIFKECF